LQVSPPKLNFGGRSAGLPASPHLSKFNFVKFYKLGYILLGVPNQGSVFIYSNKLNAFMEPIFTLPYSEFAVAKELIKHFKKKEGYSISIPISRQQKGFDVLLYNQKTKKSVAMQVKSSRTWEGTIPKRKLKHERFKYYTWFNTFQVEEGYADFYILFGVYTKSIHGKKLDKSREIKKWYSHILLCLNEKEMIDFLKELTTKSEDKQDTKFGFGFNDEKRICLTRGATNQPEISKFLFTTKIREIKKALS